MNSKAAECCKYFKEHKGFHRLLCGIRDKYVSLSRCGGNVKITGLTDEEKAAFEGFFCRSYEKNKSVTVSVEKFVHALEKTKFSSVSLDELLEGYFGETLESRQDRKEREKREWEAFFQEILDSFQETFSSSWLRAVLKKEDMRKEYAFLRQLYTEDRVALGRMLMQGMKAADSFPAFQKSTVRLAIFAAEASGDPHYFDEGTKANKLLSYFMEYYAKTILNKEPFGRDSDKAYTVEMKKELMYRAGLLKDDISNYTIVFGIHCMLKNGALHQGLEGFLQERQPAVLMLYAFSSIQSAFGACQPVYIVENPSVFSAIMERMENKTCSLVCTSGQLTLASLLLLDLLAESGSTLYYAGDFDPEGLQIAEKLKIRFGKKLILWHYHASDYNKAKSEVILEENRLVKLRKVQSEELQEIKSLLLQEKRAGYQESLAELYIRDTKLSIPKPV